MPKISLTREIKLTNEDALKIIDSKPSEKLQAILEFIEVQGAVVPMENKLIVKYVQFKKQVQDLFSLRFCAIIKEI